ncbi:hypothetical protein HPO96_33960 [Kribbella sandramycini]|uniref:Antibiotic biosynthesis monooxygenase n=1 Tax=Kribbella sandramycini TaxID=60450 RepID=A0A7Y4L8F8_9ACTN|nr:hypothetical protein [Kribbella sandramycini]MBB6570404.1 hypothetical protein [Kribbella sandramycini]NOL45266.1 hypothetical protein [Kribbella sandramycini]
MAGFVQIIEYRTSRPSEVVAPTDDFRAKREAEGDGPMPERAVTCADRNDPDHYYTIVEFASYEEAMANSARPDTGEFAARMAELCDGPATYRDLDVVT